MSLEIGRTTATIIGHRVIHNEDRDQLVVVFQGETDYGEPVSWSVYITEKSASIARAQLKVCGADVNRGRQILGELSDRPDLLAGNKVPLIVEPFNGQLRASVVIRQPPSKSVSERFGAMLEKKADAAPKSDDDDLPF